MKRLHHSIFSLLKGIIAVLVALSALWCAGALHFIFYDIALLSKIAPYAFLLISIGAFIFYPKTSRVLAVYACLATMIFLTWFFRSPSNDRDWLQEYAKIAHAEQQGKDITVHNIRDFKYHGSRENVTPHYKTITYNIDDLEGVDIVLSYWDDQTMIAHMMFVFRFTKKDNLVLSVETRREKDEPWTIPHGFFNQYEMIYLLGTEEDLIGRRINISNEDVFLYPTTATKKKAQELFINTINVINNLEEEPRFYNTLTKNCGSFLFDVAERPDLFEWFNPALILNGVSDRYMRKVGAIEGEGTYWKFKYNHYISARVKAAKNRSIKFSDLIREHNK